MKKVSVVIRNKNQEKALSFLLNNLTNRFQKFIAEIIVLDNLSTDESKEVTLKFGAKFISIEQFGYGSSANIGMENCNSSVVVIFSAHAFPVSHDFFKLIIDRFNNNENLAGLRCIHNVNDFRHYILGNTAKINPRECGLIFCGSAVNRDIWEKNKFKDDIITMEDKEWTIRVLKQEFDIEFIPSIFCYDINRNRSQEFFRFKNETYGSYYLWNYRFSFLKVVKGFIFGLTKKTKNYLFDIFYIFKKFIFQVNFFLRKK